ncbi:hypothetical protein [Sulfitobacter donghicola]|uniref:hypothetical protein n=1 Tax=Sulfitobacter donghicola TaxID=421000 RepID=UPI0012DCA8BD|nr:hypothetical protein [Sulfitobacter donghicola]
MTVSLFTDLKFWALAANGRVAATKVANRIERMIFLLLQLLLVDMPFRTHWKIKAL